MKDFDEFPGLDDDDMSHVLEAVAASLGIECDDESVSVPVGKLPMFAMLYSNLNARAQLRKYHEWLQSDGQLEQPTWQTWDD